EQLGLSARTLVSGVFGTFFDREGRIEWFARSDEPGCSMGFSRFYEDYVLAGLLRTTFVGDAYSIGISARSAYALEYKKLSRDNTAAFCYRPDCLSCRGLWRYNAKDWPLYWARISSRKLKQLTARLAGA